MLSICEHCREEVSYIEKEATRETILKGKKYTYIGKEAICNECHEPIFVPEIHDYNLMQLDLKFRKEENIITLKEIEKILDMYKIGKRPLSLALGWGELTLTRFLDGDMPSKMYSDTLRKVLESRDSFIELLESNKEKLSEVTYRKVNEKIAEPLEGKIDCIAKYIIHRCEDITPLALQKLLYYSQSFHKAFYGKYLFNDDCEAWVHGPVYPEVYQHYKINKFNPIEIGAHDKASLSLTESETDTLESVIFNFGCFSGKILEKMTHIEKPWIEARGSLSSLEPCTEIIEKRLLKCYFADIKEKYKMLNISDVNDYSVDLFNKINH